MPGKRIVKQKKKISLYIKLTVLFMHCFLNKWENILHLKQILNKVLRTNNAEFCFKNIIFITNLRSNPHMRLTRYISI